MWGKFQVKFETVTSEVQVEYMGKPIYDKEGKPIMQKDTVDAIIVRWDGWSEMAGYPTKVQIVLNHFASLGAGSNLVTVVPTGNIDDGYFTGTLHTVTAGWTVVNKEHAAEFELPWTKDFFEDLELKITSDGVYIYPHGVK